MRSTQGRSRYCRHGGRCFGTVLPLETQKATFGAYQGEGEARNKTSVYHHHNHKNINSCNFGPNQQNLQHRPRNERGGGINGEKDGDSKLEMDADERYSDESVSERKKSDAFVSSSEKIKKRLESLAKERDCAVEMWNLAKEAADAKREEALKWAAEAEKLAFRMEEMQKDYSEAIKLMERKVELLESELDKSNNKNRTIESELHEIKRQYQEAKTSVAKSSSELEQVIKERNELKESLEQTKELLFQAEKVSLQARDKVTDALAMAQDALANEASITEEKARLEDAMAEILTAAEQKLAKEVERTRKEMENKITDLQTQLHTLTIEKNKVSLENESVKSEFRIRHNQTMEKTKSLHHELEEMRSKRQSDLVQWTEERDSLRRQVASLHGDTESLLAQLRRRQMPCPECKDQKLQVERYKKLAKKWEETADGVTQNFEQYLKEAKKAYIANTKNSEVPVGKT